MSSKWLCTIVLLISTPGLLAQAQTPITIRIDLTDTSRHILHITEQLPGAPRGQHLPLSGMDPRS